MYRKGLRPDSRDERWKAQLVRLAQIRDAGEVHFETVPRSDRSPGRAVRAPDLIELVLETSGGDDLEDAARSVAGIPEGVPLARGLNASSPTSA